MSLRGAAQGFSLVELMLTLSIIVLAMGMGFAVTREGRGHMSVDQVARQLLADLRWARQQAMARGAPAGILLPGTTAAGQAYDVVEASLDAPGAMRVVRTEDWSADGHYAMLAVGTWGGLPFQPGDGTFPGRPDPSAQTFLTQCAKTWPGRYVMFGENGTVTTSGVPNANGRHYLVVTAGLQSSGDNLDAVWWPASTVRLSADGYASVVNGVPSHPDMRSASPHIPALGSLPPDLPPGPLHYPKSYAPPTIVKLDVLPTANVDALPPGAVLGSTYSLAPNGRMSLAVTAQDPNGDALYCNWYSGGIPGVPPDTAPKPPTNTVYDAPSTIGGTFSVDGIQPMARSATAGQWTDAVEWSPPITAKPGDWFELGVVIDDLRGGKDARWIVVGVIQDKKIVFDRSTGAGAEIFTMNEDGTNPLRLTTLPGTCAFPSWSPDGNRIAFVRRMSSSVYRLYSMSVDGSGLLPLTSDLSASEWPTCSFSPEATTIAYSLWEGGTAAIELIRDDGSNPDTGAPASARQLFSSQVSLVHWPSWFPDSGSISFWSIPLQPSRDDWHICRLNVSDGRVRRLYSSNGGLYDTEGLDVSPDGSRVLFSSSAALADRFRIYVMSIPLNSSPSLPVVISADGQHPRWGVDGQVIVFNSNRDGQYHIYRVKSDGTMLERLTNTAADDSDPCPRW